MIEKKDYSDKIINGKELAEIALENLKSQLNLLKTETPAIATLAIILVGDDSASEIYVNNKIKKCEQVGVYSDFYKLPVESTKEDILFLIDVLNKDENCNGILVQLPLPNRDDEDEVINSILPEKDIDGFTQTNRDRLKNGGGIETIFPATPLAILELLNEVLQNLKDKKACVIGKSKIVGEPIAQMLKNLGTDVVIIDSKTEKPAESAKNCDIIVSAAGVPNLVNSEWIKAGAIVIDVGISRLPNGKIVGDVDFSDVIEKVSYITPVPGGVGPMTIVMLLSNVIKAFKKQNNLSGVEDNDA